MEDKGKCVSCGFLTKFDVYLSGPPPHFYEMPPSHRATGNIEVVRLESGREIRVLPRCYMDYADIWKEIDTLQRSGTTLPSATMQVFQADRKCPKWHPYRSGFSPMQHREEIMQTELDLKRQEFELKLFAMSQKVQEDSRAIAEMTYRFNRRWTWILVLFALGSIFAQLMFPNGMKQLMEFVLFLQPSK